LFRGPLENPGVIATTPPYSRIIRDTEVERKWAH
jgi:hypothetical protein